MILLNAFSPNMLGAFPASVSFEEIDAAAARTALLCYAEEEGMTDLPSAIGHADTAALLTGQLNWPVPVNRASVTLKPGDWAIIAQYSGPRLPEGATTLPEGAILRWLMVNVH